MNVLKGDLHMTNPRNNDLSGALFNNLMRRFDLARDIDLAVFIGTPAYYVPEVRNGKRVIGDRVLLRICEKTGMTVKAARAKIAERA